MSHLMSMFDVTFGATQRFYIVAILLDVFVAVFATRLSFAVTERVARSRNGSDFLESIGYYAVATMFTLFLMVCSIPLLTRVAREAGAPKVTSRNLLSNRQSDSSIALSNLDATLSKRALVARDSLASALQKAVRGTYPYPSRTSIRWVVIEKPDTAYDGQYNAGRLSIGVTPHAFSYTDRARGLETILSHEVGHSLDPMWQEDLANSDSAIRARYGPNHLEKLREFDERFRSAMLRSNSIVQSKSFPFSFFRNQVQSGKMTASEYKGQYLAGLFSCYLTPCSHEEGAMSSEELGLLDEYVSYLNGGPFDRHTTHQARAKLLAPLEPLMSELSRHYVKK